MAENDWTVCVDGTMDGFRSPKGDSVAVDVCLVRIVGLNTVDIAAVKPRLRKGGNMTIWDWAKNSHGLDRYFLVSCGIVLDSLLARAILDKPCL